MSFFSSSVRTADPGAKRTLVASELLRKVEKGGFYISDLVFDPDKAAVSMATEIITGHRKDRHGVTINAPPLRGKFKLRTIDGKPLGRVKISDIPMKASARRRARMLGQPTTIFQDFPAEFEVDAPTALMLLQRYGYGMSWPRILRPSAAARGQRDSRGHLVRGRQRWRLVEVGHRFEKQAIRELSSFENEQDRMMAEAESPAATQKRIADLKAQLDRLEAQAKEQKNTEAQAKAKTK